MLRKPWGLQPGWRVGARFRARATTSASSGNGNGASARSVTRRRDSRAASACSISRSRRFDGFIAGAAASTPSRSPNSFSSCAAVFGPIPGTPGTLSTESPISACASISLSGVTPNFSITSGGPIGFCLIGSSISTPGRSNCIRSLSDDTMVTVPPRIHRGLRVGGDQVVGLPVGQFDRRHAERIRRLAHQGELRDQLLGRRRSVRLVLVVDAVAECLAPRVEDDRQMGADVLAAATWPACW